MQGQIPRLEHQFNMPERIHTNHDFMPILQYNHLMFQYKIRKGAEIQIECITLHNVGKSPNIFKKPLTRPWIWKVRCAKPRRVSDIEATTRFIGALPFHATHNVYCEVQFELVELWMLSYLLAEYWQTYCPRATSPAYTECQPIPRQVAL